LRRIFDLFSVLMGVGRYELSDSQWSRIEGMLPGRVETIGRKAADNRIFINGVFWVVRSGAHESESYPSVQVLALEACAQFGLQLKGISSTSSGKSCPDAQIRNAQCVSQSRREGAFLMTEHLAFKQTR
jgi:hypothetical protein